MKTVLFVCTGNICRSPMAEGLFRHATRGRTDSRVLSAGVGALEGQAPSSHAVRALNELGIDISPQRSRMLTSELVEEADYIFGMTHSHVDQVNLLFPQAAERHFCCGSLTKLWTNSRRTSAIPLAALTRLMPTAAT